MAEEKNYFEKTSVALKNMHKSIVDLDVAISDELTEKKNLKTNLDHLKEEIRLKAANIDEIINTLNGALK